METGFLDSIRAGFETVARLSRHVSIRHDLIPAYADALPCAAPANVMDEEHHFRGGEEDTASYILVLDSVNFGSGYHPHMKAEGWRTIDDSIYYTLSTRLKSRYEMGGPLSADRLSSFTAEDCIALFALNGDGPQCRIFAGLCAASLRDTGAAVRDLYGGSFLSMVRAAGGSAEAMAAMLATLPHFNDVHDYRGCRIPFYKRAQITAADLHLAFNHLSQAPLFGDIDRLTMFPDNGVPHVFRMDGILEYAPDLSRRIDAGEDIPSGSEDEIEIRACAGQAVELIAAGKGMSAMAIDHILWHKSVEDPRYKEKPPHRTPTLFY